MLRTDTPTGGIAGANCDDVEDRRLAAVLALLSVAANAQVGKGSPVISGRGRLRAGPYLLMVWQVGGALYPT
jgi:hypothetical protein